MSPESSVETDGPSVTPGGPIGTGHRRRFLLVLAAVLVGGWLASLTVLAFLAANPVTINREQILSSDAVIIGVRDAGTGDGDRVRVERQLAGRGVPSHLRLSGFAESASGNASRFVIPLRRTRDSFEITPAPETLDSRRFVYPASPETLEAVAKVLATGDERPYP